MGLLDFDSLPASLIHQLKLSSIAVTIQHGNTLCCTSGVVSVFDWTQFSP